MYKWGFLGKSGKRLDLLYTGRMIKRFSIAFHPHEGIVRFWPMLIGIHSRIFAAMKLI